MFLKPFKVKSNNQLKGTERKKLCEDVSATHPALTDAEIQNLLPKKEAISVMKVVTHDGETCKLYCVAKVPMFFQLDQPNLYLYPTVYTLWQYPDLLYTFTTHRPVISKLASGAGLMLPGVVLDGPPTIKSYGKLEKHTPVAVNTEDNKAPVAVGVTSHSSHDMYMCGGHGKCVDIIHVVGDALCQLGKPPARPDLGPANKDKEDPAEEQEQQEEDNSEVTDVCDNPKDTEDLTTNVEALRIEESQGNFDENEATTDLKEESDSLEDTQAMESNPVEEMDKLLEYSFLKACKTMKKGELPILSSNFFKNHVITACPPDQTIDIKKSSHKKLSVFLAKMKSKGVIDTNITKGVESVTYIQSENPLLKSLVINEERERPAAAPSNAPVVAECYRVTADVLPVLSKFGYEKGDVLKRAEIRKSFMDYVKRENLQEEKMLRLNPQLAGIFRTKESVLTLTIEDAINKFIGRMTHTHEITVAGNRILHTGKLEPIDITVTTRCNNKKVTLVNNLEQFGIKLDEFSRECQGIGASATITDVPGKKTPSVLVQGNQVIYVHKLLTEKYRINKNYIRGLEFAPKKRK